MALISAEVTKVLGEYDHSLHFAEGEDFVIIYGPNGVGKTKFLEVIHFATKLDGRQLSRIPFEEAIIKFSDSTELRVFSGEEDIPETDPVRRRKTVVFHLFRDGERLGGWKYIARDFEEWLIVNTAWRPKSGDLWEDRTDGEIAHFSDLEIRYANSGVRSRATRKIPPEFSSFREKTSSFLIETQRLRIAQYIERRPAAVWPNSPRSTESSRISEHAAKMRSLVQDAQTEHSRITQQLDRTFPNRVLEKSIDASVADTDVRDRYNEQNAFRSRLGRVVSVALEDALSLPARTLLDWELTLLSLYLDDTEKKLAPFEALIQKIELLEQIINSRLLKKKLQVTAGDGLNVIHETSENRIDLDSLSSGEQHEIILMFDLLFNVPRGALVLIDEPEISLHVVWQLAFIPDVQRISKLAGFRFVVATHSPQIINDAWDRAVRLGPPEAAFS